MTTHISMCIDSYILDDYCKAKLKFENKIDIQNIKLEAINFYNNETKYIEAYTESSLINNEIIYYGKQKWTKEKFEEYFFERIKKGMKRELDNIISKLNLETNRISALKDKIIEVNKLNRKPKKTFSYYESKYVNLYYIYNAGIHQIVRIKKFFNKIELIIEKPSGKLTSFILPKENFEKRKFFLKKSEADEYLKNIWAKENKIPKFREKLFK